MRLPAFSLFPILVGLGFTLLGSCALDRFALGAVADALSTPGNNQVFTGDDDPELVADALPFAIKMYESILSARPDHGPLRSTVGSLYVMYANAFVEGPAKLLPDEAFDHKYAGLRRAKNLYLRGVDHLGQVLEARAPGMAAVFSGTAEASTLPPLLERMRKDDVPALYWFAAGWLSAASLDVMDGSLAIRIPQIKAVVDRAYALDPDWDQGALHGFYQLYYASLPPSLGGDAAKSLWHYEELLRINGGIRADAWMARAETWALPRQDRAAFVEFMDRILALDPRDRPAQTLVTVLAQRKAKYYLDNVDLLFWSDTIIENPGSGGY